MIYNHENRSYKEKKNKLEHLSNIQQIILEITKEIIKLCNENDIKYYILGGTLLGAVRHKGFIPWDDDIDIGIPRNDYEKFLRIVKSSLIENLQLNTYANNKDHHYYFSRIVDKRYKLVRMGSLVERKENIWVDIFPIDGMPNNFLLRKIHMIRLLVARALYHISCFEKVNLKRPNRPLSERFIIKLVQITGMGKNGDTLQNINRIDRLLKKYEYRKSNFIVNFMGQYKFKEMFHKKYYGNGKLYTFEDIELVGPENYDEILKKMYGDYMTPPKDNYKNAHAVKFDEVEYEE